jgi:hypothetical protein
MGHVPYIYSLLVSKITRVQLAGVSTIYCFPTILGMFGWDDTHIFGTGQTPNQLIIAWSHWLEKFSCWYLYHWIYWTINQQIKLVWPAKVLWSSLPFRFKGTLRLAMITDNMFLARNGETIYALCKSNPSQEHFRLADWQWRSGHSSSKKRIESESQSECSQQQRGKD